MTWTYSVSQLATSSLMQVRYLMGDTKSTDQQVQDEEITFALTQRPSVYGGAATVCRALASRLAREADTVDKDLRTVLSARSRAYLRMATDYEMQAAVRGGALPYAGGISVSDKQSRESNTDRVQPLFNIGMQDNPLPVGAAGNETEGQTSDDGIGPD